MRQPVDDRRPRRRTSTTVIALGAVMALIAAACGDDDDDDASGSAASTAAAAATTAAGPATTTPATTAGTDDSPETSAASTEPATTDPYRIQLISDLTGPASGPNGIPGSQGVQLAFEQANAAGGVNGRQIDYQLQDSMSTADGGATAAQAAVAGNATAIVHSGVSSSVVGALPVWQTAQQPVFVMTSFDDMVFPVTPWWYAFGTTQTQWATAFVSQMTELAGGSLEGKKVAAEVIDAPSGRLVSDAAVAMAEAAGAEIIGTYPNPPGSSSFTSQAQDIVSKGADFVMIADSATVIVAKALQTAGFEGYMLSGTGRNDAATFEAIDSDRFQAFRFVNEPEPDGEIAQEAAKYGLTAAGSYFSQGYAVGNVVIDALEVCDDPCDNEQFIAAADSLGSIDLPDGLGFGPLEITPERHYLLTKFAWFEWDPVTKQAVQGNVVDVTDGAPAD